MEYIIKIPDREISRKKTKRWRNKKYGREDKKEKGRGVAGSFEFHSVHVGHQPFKLDDLA